MSFLPQHSQLGRLEYLEIFTYYDRPCLFSCRNEARQIYLAVWVDEVNTHNRWIYAPISPYGLDRLKKSCVDIRSAFTHTCSGYVYDVKISQRNICCVEYLCCSDLTDDLLPVAGEFLKHQ